MKLLTLFLSSICCACAQIGSDLQPEAYKYLRELNSAGLLNPRQKRQSGSSDYRYVTQCDYTFTEKPTDTPSIEIFGTGLERSDSVLKAAKLIHRMMRFMPRDLFVRLANRSSVGLYDFRGLPTQFFPEFEEMPVECGANCGTQTFVPGLDRPYDCSQWCTNSLYPYYQRYPINYLWSYGNFSRTFVVEGNVACQYFNPSYGNENFLVREFALTIMTRALGNEKLAEIFEAYKNAVANEIWFQFVNEYDYFMKASLVWFNGVSSKDISGMNCKFYNDGSIPICVTGHHMRMYIKAKDPLLYNILNYVFNNNREYAQSFSEVCEW